MIAVKGLGHLPLSVEQNFKQLPDGLTQASQQLTFRWLDDATIAMLPEAAAVRAQIIAITVASVSGLGAAMVFILSIIAGSSHTAIVPLLALAILSIAGAVVLYSLRQEGPDSLREWRMARCDPNFWQPATIKPREFEREAIDLIAGALGTKGVALTRDVNDYGIDALAFKKPIGRIVVQCKHWKDKIEASHVRELAGCVQFFNAQQGILFCQKKPDEDSDQWREFAERFHLAYWDLDCVLQVAAWLANREKLATANDAAGDMLRLFNLPKEAA